MDLVSLLLVGGSAAAVVILGVLIYRGVPSKNKSEVTGFSLNPPVVTPFEKTPVVETKSVQAELKPSVRITPVPVELIAEVSEAPPPFSEEPMILRRKRSTRSALPTDTTALKGISSDAGMGGVLVISAPKRKVRA